MAGRWRTDPSPRREDRLLATGDVRAAARELTAPHTRLAPLLGYTQAQRHARTYLRGPPPREGRENVEAIALHEGGEDLVLPPRRSLTRSPWDAQDVRREIQARLAEALVPPTARWAPGAAGGLDDSGFPKEGARGGGVQRRRRGRLGKKESCRVGVPLAGITPAGQAPLDRRLYLPQGWALDKPRRRRAGVPRSVTFRAKPRIGLDLLARLTEAGHVALDGSVFDEGDGRGGTFPGRVGAAAAAVRGGSPRDGGGVDGRPPGAGAPVRGARPAACRGRRDGRRARSRE